MNLQKLYHSVKHTHLAQLLARIRLLTKRKWMEQSAGYFNKRFKKKSVAAKITSDPPFPIFKKREGEFSEINKDFKSFSLSFLNESRSYQLPINWHEKELENGTRLWKLNLHYMEFLEGVDDEWFEWIVDGWIKQNLPYKKGYWLDSWNSFALSIRIVVWMQQIAKRRKELDAGFVETAKRSIYKQLLFLEKNIEEDVRGNHIIKNIKALLWGAAFFQKDKNVERWLDLGKELLDREIDQQVLPDGMHFERSPAYHIQVFADLLECYKVLDKSRVKDELTSILPSMAQVVADLRHPDGLVAQFNDGGENMAYNPQEVLNVYEKVGGIEIESQSYFEYPKAGYYGLRNSNDYIIYDAGKIAPDELPGHGHGDIFSFEWSVKGKRIIIDKGVYEYNQGTKRKKSRSTLSHNTVNIDHEDQCEFWKAFRVARRAEVDIKDYDCSDKIFSVEASHDGYKRLNDSPIHKREFVTNLKEINIKDTISGGGGQNAESRLLFHPSCSISIKDGTCKVINGDVEILIKSDSDMEIINSIWFPNFGQEISTKQLIIKYGSIPVEGKIRLMRIN